MASSSRPHVVVIGSGFGGLFATQAMADADVDITLIGKTVHHLFQPLLYQVATGILSPGEIAPSTRDVDLSITTARSRLHMANMVDTAAQSNVRVLVVGPPPTLDPDRNRRIADLSAAFADVVTRRNHIYVDTFNPLQHHEQWRKDLAANHGNPGQAGYGLMAWLVLHAGWQDWLSV